MSRIKSITKKKMTKDDRLWNLAVAGDESYIANNIVVHNCRSILVPLTIFEKWEPTEKIKGMSVDAFIDENKHEGFGKK